jgi:AraC family ethanolamine operon transcriptional activator
MADRTETMRIITRFDDFEELGSLVQGWGLDYRIIDCGRFFGEHHQIVTPEILISEARYNRHLLQKGSTPPGMRTFGIITQETTPFIWRKQEVTRNSILIFPKGAELDATTFPGFHVYTLSIQENLLEEKLQREEEQQSFLRQQLNQGGVLKVKYATIQALRNFLKQALHKTNERPDVLKSEIFRQRLYNEATDFILEILTQGERNSLSVSFRKYARIVMAVDEWLADTAFAQHSVYGMARALKINERTLRRVLSGWYGVPPKQYLLARRLHEVRKALIQPLDSKTEINVIANRMGFTHMGNFAALYRRQFGELPSETLKNR